MSLTQTELTDENELIEFLVIYNKERFQIQFPIIKTILNLKEHLQTLTCIPPSMQKIMFKGLAKDECTLKELNVKKNDKLMLIGSKLEDVALANSKPTAADLAKPSNGSPAPAKLKFCEETAHKKVLDKYGKPDDIMPGILNCKESLPDFPLSGMLNKAGHKVRLTFKLETDELWISTKERTDKIPMSTIKSVISEAITGHEEYHIMAIQIGPTEASRYWIYWVPAQYVTAIRTTLLS